VKLREAVGPLGAADACATLIRARNADMIFSAATSARGRSTVASTRRTTTRSTDGSDAGSDFQTIGLASYWTLRFNIGF
jgi:hypothetical protein